VPVVYSFPFRRYHVDGRRVFRPVFGARLRSPLGAIATDMLVDSGADCSLIDRRHAEQLGLRLEEVGGGRTVSRRLAISRSEVLVEVHHPSGWLSPVRIRVEVPSRPMGLPFAVLGREGFFEAFDIAFTLCPIPERGMFHIVRVETPGARQMRPGPPLRGRRRPRLAG
jgi:hypothetical protein